MLDGAREHYRPLVSIIWEYVGTYYPREAYNTSSGGKSCQKGRVNLRRFLMGAGAGCSVVVMLFLVVVVLAVLIAPPERGSKAPEKEAEEPQQKKVAKKEAEGEPVPVTIRVSGALGTPYRCTYSSYALEEGERDPVRYESEDRGTLGAVPVEYESQAIDSYPWSFDFVDASCNITNASGTRSAQGGLTAQILVNGEVKAEESTRPDPPGKKSRESETVTVRWSPRCPDWEVDWDCG